MEVVISTRVVELLDHARRRSMQTRAGYLRDAVLDRLKREGLIKVDRLSDSSIYALEFGEVLA